MADQINAVSDMRWRRHERQVLISDFVPFRSGGMDGPIAFPYAILNVNQSQNRGNATDKVMTDQAMELMEDRERRSLRCNGRVFEKAALYRK